MNRKKILMVGHFPPAVGGITTCMQNILTSNLKKEFDFLYFTTTRPTIGITKNVYNYSLLFNMGFKNLILSVLTTMYHVIKFPLVLISSNSEIVHINTTDYWPFWESAIYVLIAKLFSRKTILHIHATKFKQFFNNENHILKQLIIKTLIMVDKIIILSPRQKDFFLKFIPEDHLSIISNVTNFDKFKNNKKNNSDVVRVIFIGGEEAKRKGIYDVLKAIPIVVNKYRKNIIFTFLGKCDVKNLTVFSRKKKIEKYVEFLGYVKEQKKIDIMNSSDIFILPSYAEGLPIAMLEAMAAGLPIISTSVGSIPEVIDENINGYLIEPGDYIALADRIIELASDLKLRQQISNNNKEKINTEYDLKTMTFKMNNLYGDILHVK